MKKKTRQTDKIQRQIQFKFQSYRLVNFYYQEPPEGSINKRQPDLNFNLQSAFQFNKEKKTISTIFRINIKTKKDKPTLVSTMEVHFDFKIRNFESFLIEDSVKVPKDFIAILMNLSVSTARGILLARGAGTILERAILPIIDPRKLIPDV